MVHADCPRGYRNVNGICVPLKSRQVRTSQYLSLFSNDGGGGGSDDVYVPDIDDIMNNPDDIQYDVPDQTSSDNIVSYTFSKHGEQGQYTISNTGEITLQYDNGFVEIIQPDQYAEFLADDQYVFADKIIDFLMPYITPEIEEEIHEEETQDDLDEETEVLGPDNYSIINSFNYVNEDGYWRQGTAHLYGDHVVIFDADGDAVVDASISYDVEGRPNRFSVTYNGSDFVYNNSGVIQDMSDAVGPPAIPSEPTVGPPTIPSEPTAPEELEDENDSPPRGVDSEL